MRKATYDTNTLVSGTVSLYGPTAQIIDAWINQEVVLITSEPLINELERTLNKSYFTARLSPEKRQSFVALVRARATIVPPAMPLPTTATHPEDDVVLATAESGQAEFIVTGDSGLRALQSYKGILILSPREFMTRLQQAAA